jgi:hypothetical protein
MKASTIPPLARGLGGLRIPRWAWISAALAMVLVPVLLVWLALKLLGGAWQAGNGLAEQARSWVGVVAPDVAREADAVLAEVRQAADVLAPLATDPVESARALVDAKTAEAAATVRESLGEAGAELAAKAAAATALAGGVALTGEEAVAEHGQATSDAESGALAPLPTLDVAGEDPEGFTRMAGFVRTAFRRSEDGITVVYVGIVPQADVMAFHRQALEQAGYTAIVQSADATGTTIEFRGEGRTLVLSALSEAGDRTRLEVRVV